MTKSEREAGVVSLMVTMVMMIVISLVVLGFAEIARNEQRSSLDSQLSVQAYYAAESGINDVRSVINAAVAAGGPTAVQDKTKCGPQGSYTASGAVDLNNGHDVSYTCVLVDTQPPTLNTDLGDGSAVIPLLSSGPAFNTITLSWSVAKGFPATASGCYTNLANLTQNPVAGKWSCNYPMVRVDLLDANGGLSRSNWATATTTAFLVPFNSNSVANTLGAGAHGTAVPARCDKNSCSVTISGLIGTKYYLRATTLYRDHPSLSVSNSAGAHFIGAQAIIDATGKAQDVLRRVQVAVDLTDANAHAIPSGAIITRESICKRFGITDSTFRVYTDLSSGGDGNTYCALH